MATKEHLSDDYIAKLLAKDAKSSNARFSAYGFNDSLPQRSTVNAPKPNTKFLKNILRETDSHNAALRAKELEESRARLRKIRNSSGITSPSRQEDGRLSREDHRPSKRRRLDGEDDRDKQSLRDYEEREPRHKSKAHSRYRHSSHAHREYYYSSEDDGVDRSSRRRRKHHHHRNPRRRSESRSDECHNRNYKGRRRSISRHRSRSRSPRRERSHHRSRRKRFTPPTAQECRNIHQVKSPMNGIRASPSASETTLMNIEKSTPSTASDSDPLESIVGPLPPPPAPKVKSRGRGNFSSASAMDTHFSSGYDPSMDVQPDLDVEDDWDMALEALRDRQRWQKQGAERLKAAGFTEEEVNKWENGGEKTEEDVRWKGKGEGREWDRGKVVDGDGVETKPEWGRLKGT